MHTMMWVINFGEYSAYFVLLVSQQVLHYVSSMSAPLASQVLLQQQQVLK